jgi:hypothetical protein
LLKNGHLPFDMLTALSKAEGLRFPYPSSLRRTGKYVSLLRISGALHLTLFEQPGKDDFFSGLLEPWGKGRLLHPCTAKTLNQLCFWPGLYSG